MRTSLPCCVAGFYAFNGDNQPGSEVVFRASDGGDKELWRMKPDRFGELNVMVPFLIPLQKNQRFHLIVDCPGANSQCWTTWIDPVLVK